MRLSRLPGSLLQSRLHEPGHRCCVPVQAQRGSRGADLPAYFRHHDFHEGTIEKQESIASLTAEITSITANIDTLKGDLKEKKAALKSTQKELTKLEAKKVAADQKAAEAAKNNEAENLVKKLLADGVSADDIIEKLK